MVIPNDIFFMVIPNILLWATETVASLLKNHHIKENLEK